MLPHQPCRVISFPLWSSVLPPSSTGLTVMVSLLSFSCSSLPWDCPGCEGRGAAPALSSGLGSGEFCAPGFARLAKSRAVPKCPLCILFRMGSTALGAGQCLHLVEHENQVVYPQNLLWIDGFAFQELQCRREMLWLPWAVPGWDLLLILCSASLPFHPLHPLCVLSRVGVLHTPLTWMDLASHGGSEGQDLVWAQSGILKKGK